MDPTSSNPYYNFDTYQGYPISNSTLLDSSLTNSIPSAPDCDENFPLDSLRPYSQVFQTPNEPRQYALYPPQMPQAYYTEYPSYPPPYVPVQPQPTLPTHPSLIDRVVQAPLKLIGGLCFGGLSVLFGGCAFIAGSMTSLLFATGNPSCLLTGILTLSSAAGAWKCAQVALRIFNELRNDIF